jgi:NAD(P)-dependent dehydrogenase (short-subunit alcohol dehydrogenase family)
VILNVSSDAAINPYPRWGAYGASKAALHHLSRIWTEELATEGIAVMSLDPGDMDTPLHAVAAPDADRSELKRPATAAREFADAIGERFCFMKRETKAILREGFDDSRAHAHSAPTASEASCR